MVTRYPILDDTFTHFELHSYEVPDNFGLEEVDHNDSERVLCKSTSTRRELKKLNNSTGYKARKEFWR
jgi:hypothetical protein